jgi:hypothetical protein
MRFFGSTRALLIVSLIAAFGSFGPAIDGAPVPEPLAPQIVSYLDYGTKSLTITCSGGIPETLGVLNIAVVSTPVPVSLPIPFLFDDTGGAVFTIPLADLNNGLDLVVGLQLFTLDYDLNLVASPIWALTTRNYIVTDPAHPPCFECPTSPGGWVDWVFWPGLESGPVYPHTIVAWYTSEERGNGQPMMVLESGPAGSFPIN